jgi:hypothetical protein
MKNLIRSSCLLATLFAASVRMVNAQRTPAPADTPAPPWQAASERDHRRTLDLLHIPALRPGADNNHPDSPNAVNYDESKGNPYAKLPDPLTLNDGKKVATPRMWWLERRPQIAQQFDREVYGRVPAHTPKVTWRVTSLSRWRNGDVPVVTKGLTGHVDNSAYPSITVNIDLTLTTPAEARGPVPVIMQLGFDPAVIRMILQRMAAQGMKPPPPPPGPTWQQQILTLGWGYAVLIPTSVQADNGAGLTEGIIGLCNQGQPRKLDDWGALRAWAWGASRALDYFQTDKSVDARRVGLEGHSRMGKAALLAMSYDPRFAIAYVSSSGAGGAVLYRRNFGERLENVAASNEYHWMAGNFLKYAGPLTAGDLPVDSHELIALCAPRPVFIGGGATQGDGWADAQGMFLAAVGAGPVYRLLGKQDMGTTQFPPLGTPLIDGDLAFCQHAGGHTDAPNWPVFLQFTRRAARTIAHVGSHGQRLSDRGIFAMPQGRTHTVGMGHAATVPLSKGQLW